MSENGDNGGKGDKGDKDDKKSGEFNFDLFSMGLGAVIGAIVGAAVTYVTGHMWNAHQDQLLTSSGSELRPSTSNWGADEESDENLGARRKQREAVRDENIPDEMKCIICYDNPREVCLTPCGHVCICEDCADKIDSKCPVCQQEYTSKKAVYM